MRVAMLAIAVALSVKTGVAAVRLKPVLVKKHGRRAWSLFAFGLQSLRKIFAASDPSGMRLFSSDSSSLQYSRLTHCNIWEFK
jgi:hypothetical protein